MTIASSPKSTLSESDMVLLEQIAKSVLYAGAPLNEDGTHGNKGHDMKAMVSVALFRMPPRIRRWVLESEPHLFTCCGQIVLGFFALMPPEVRRLILLSEALCTMPGEEVLWTIAHEIAHSWLARDHPKRRSPIREEMAADEVVKKWGGFVEPKERKGEYALYKPKRRQRTRK